MYRYSANPAHLCAFADKIAFCRRLSIPCLELDGYVDGISFADMTPDQTEDARAALILAGICVNLSTLSCDPGDEKALRAWLYTAFLLGVENIELPAPKADEDLTVWAEGLHNACAWAGSYGIGLMLSCRDDGFLCDVSGTARAECALRALSPFKVGVILDPYAYMIKGCSVFRNGFYASHLKNAVTMIRANDGISAGNGTLPGKGCAQVRELLSLILARSYNGYLSVVPYPGYEDSEALENALESLRQELARM